MRWWCADGADRERRRRQAGEVSTLIMIVLFYRALQPTTGKSQYFAKEETAGRVGQENK